MEKALSLNNYIEEKYKNEPLFHKAFMHKSYKVKLPNYKTNDILELIGDKALDLVLYEQLYKNAEGKITKGKMDKERQNKMSEKGLAAVFDYFNLGKYVQIPDENTPFNNKLKHNIIESIAGAIFLIEDFLKAKELLKQFILYFDLGLKS